MVEPPLLLRWLFFEEPDDIDDDIRRHPDDQYPEEVIGQHGHNDHKENDRQEDWDETVSVEDFDDAGYQGWSCDSRKRFRMLLEGIDEPMAKSDRHRSVKSYSRLLGKDDAGES